MQKRNESAKALYTRLATTRSPFLTKARRCSQLTLPFLVPPEGATAGWDYVTPFQSVGSRGVTNLASKLLLALLPPNTPFFKLNVDRFELKKLDKNEKAKTALEAALSEIEQSVLDELETSASRTTSHEAFLNLVVAGNALLEVPEQGSLKVYRLDRYVVQRDPMGNALVIVIHEQVAPNVLPDEVQKALSKESREKTVDLYTVVALNKKGTHWDVWQEAGETILPESEGRYPVDKCPFIPLRFTKIDGEDYGRGLVEQFLGDLSSLETLTQALVEASVASAKVLFLVQPNGITNAQKLSKANNGDFVAGREEDVKALQLNKQADLTVTYNQAQNIEKRLELAFLLMAGAQRNADRVTAEEIRAVVQELETSLGGVYSVLAQEFQLPLASALMARMAKDQRLPTLPKKIVRPTVTTGIEALGRGNDFQKLRSFIADAAQQFGPDVVARYVNPGEYFSRSATALGINTKGLVKTDEQVAQEAAAQQEQGAMQGLAEKLGPEALRQLGQMAQQQPTS